MVSRASSGKYTHILRYNGWSQDTKAEMWFTLSPRSQGLRVTSFELLILIVRSHSVPVEVVTEEIFCPLSSTKGWNVRPQTQDKSHSIPVAPPSIPHPAPTLNLSPQALGFYPMPTPRSDPCIT